MSRNISKVSPATKFCKICKDSGLPERTYRDHNVKNEKGQLCCPTLKGICCLKCAKMGHTEKYCTVKQKGRVKETKEIEGRVKEEEKKSANLFDSLMESGLDDEPPANVTMRKPVAPPANVTMRKSIASLKMPEKKGVKSSIPLSTWLAGSPKTPPAKKSASVAPWAPMKEPFRAAKRSWADMSDDEDEENTSAPWFKKENNTAW
jgi:hypothetical protein